MNHENINNDQIWWEVLKYGVKQFSRKFSKTLAKNLGEELWILENELKVPYKNKIWYDLEMNII